MAASETVHLRISVSPVDCSRHSRPVLACGDFRSARAADTFPRYWIRGRERWVQPIVHGRAVQFADATKHRHHFSYLFANLGDFSTTTGVHGVFRCHDFHSSPTGSRFSHFLYTERTIQLLTNGSTLKQYVQLFVQSADQISDQVDRKV